MIVVIASLSALLPVICAAQSETTLPTNDEIELVLTQTERAVQQYKPLLDREETLLGQVQGSKDAADKDREVVRSLEIAVKAFRRNPQAFNSPMGFAFFEWIDDASRNALLTSGAASTEATRKLLDGKVPEAESLIHFSQACTDVSTLTYTVSENAGALYERYLKSEAAQLAKSAGR
jgi:hypothetical protein